MKVSSLVIPLPLVSSFAVSVSAAATAGGDGVAVVAAPESGFILRKRASPPPSLGTNGRFTKIRRGSLYRKQRRTSNEVKMEDPALAPAPEEITLTAIYEPAAYQTTTSEAVMAHESSTTISPAKDESSTAIIEPSATHEAPAAEPPVVHETSSSTVVDEVSSSTSAASHEQSTSTVWVDSTTTLYMDSTTAPAMMHETATSAAQAVQETTTSSAEAVQETTTTSSAAMVHGSIPSPVQHEMTTSTPALAQETTQAMVHETTPAMVHKSSSSAAAIHETTTSTPVMVHESTSAAPSEHVVAPSPPPAMQHKPAPAPPSTAVDCQANVGSAKTDLLVLNFANTLEYASAHFTCFLSLRFRASQSARKLVLRTGSGDILADRHGEGRLEQGAGSNRA